jgi:2-polyprenyl-3-methyl-5-hydroxy-6-metoxy-1,4-benzoquinol methylase
MHCSYADTETSPSAAYLLPLLQRVLADCPAHAAAVDLGCGNGALTALLLGRPHWRATGVDASPSGIRIAQEAHPEIEFILADAAGPLDGLAPGSFDLVTSVEVIEHLPEPRKLARNAFRLLRPGGLAVFTTPYHGYWKNLALAGAGRMDAHFTALWDGGHVKFWSRKTLAELLGEAGFTALRFHGAGRLPYFWKSMVAVCRKPA